MFYFLTLFGLLFVCLAQRKKCLSFECYFSLLFGLPYVLVPIYILNQAYVDTNFFRLSNFSITQIQNIGIVIFVFFLCFFWGLFLTNKIIFFTDKKIIPASFDQKNKNLKYVFFFLSLVWFLSTFSFGGPLQSVLSGAENRGDIILSGYWQYFGLMNSSLLLLPMFFIESLFFRFSKKSLLWFIISFCIALAVGLCMGGRASTVLPILFVFFVITNKIKKKYYKLLFLVLMFNITFLAIHYGRSFQYALNELKSDDRFIPTFLDSIDYWKRAKNYKDDSFSDTLMFFEHPLANILSFYDNKSFYEYPRLVVIDLVREFIGLLPGFDSPDLFGLTSKPSKLTVKYWKGLEADETESTPTWVIANRLINGGLPWLIFGSFISGFIIQQTFLILQKINISSFPDASYVFWTFFVCATLIGAEASTILWNCIGYFPILCFLFHLGKKY